MQASTRTHRASGSIGPGFALVFIETVDHSQFTAICRDSKDIPYQIRTDLVPGKGDRPEAGETWVITKAYGDWVFSHVLNSREEDDGDTNGRNRRKAVYATQNLARSEIEFGTIRLGTDFRILYIQTTVPSRVRLYHTPDAQAIDKDRVPQAEPQPGLAIVMDYLTADVLLEAPLSPVPEGFTYIEPLSKDIPISVTSVNGGPVVVTLTWVAEQ